MVSEKRNGSANANAGVFDSRHEPWADWLVFQRVAHADAALAQFPRAGRPPLFPEMAAEDSGSARPLKGVVKNDF